MADITARMDRSKLVGIPSSGLLLTNPTFRDLPKVSEGRAQPNLERIIALKPDLVIGAKSFHDQVANRLNQLGIATDLVDVDSWEALEKVTRDLAVKLDVNPEPLLNQYRSLIISKPSQSRRVLVIVSSQPILSPNRDSWAGAMLDRFHLKNVVADLQGKSPFEGYVTLSSEKLLTINPDILIVVDGGENTLQWFQNQSFWRNLKAVKDNQIYQFEYYGLVNPGSIDTIVKASEKLKAIALST
jgi:iron complex transport system substrate-binding protein